MPIVNTNQARIELTREQFLGIVEHMRAKFSTREELPDTILIEETNLGNTLLVVSSDKLMLLAYTGGEVDELKILDNG